MEMKEAAKQATSGAIPCCVGTECDPITGNLYDNLEKAGGAIWALAAALMLSTRRASLRVSAVVL